MKFLIIFLIPILFVCLSEDIKDDSHLILDVSFDVESEANYTSLKNRLNAYAHEHEELLLKQEGQTISVEVNHSVWYTYTISLSPKLVSFKYHGIRKNRNKIQRIFFKLLRTHDE